MMDPIRRTKVKTDLCSRIWRTFKSESHIVIDENKGRACMAPMSLGTKQALFFALDSVFGVKRS